jgi:hypothetical protein
LYLFALFTPAITQSFAAHWFDTGAIDGSDFKNRASGFPLTLPAAFTVLAFA